MENPIQIKLREEARQFLIDLPPDTRKKFTLAFRKTEAGFKGEWFKNLPVKIIFTSSGFRAITPGTVC